MLRSSLAALALLALAACGEQAAHDGQAEAAVLGPGYTLEVRADEDTQTFLVAHGDGRVVAARATGEESALLDQRDARALLSEPMGLAAPPPGDARVSFRFPGFSLAVSGDEDDGADEHARVSIRMGGHSVEVDAVDGADGETERAHVRITGADEDDVRDFIAKADQLAPAVQAEMLEALGL